ncbi:MAG: glycoside hydrolase, partial [Verrucomicrobia bacterium]
YLRATEHLTVTNCVLTTACNALKLGTESSGGFKDILFNNCSIFSDLERWRGRRATSGLSLEMVDGGALERVGVSNLIMRDVRAPIFVRLGNRGRAQTEAHPQHLRDISISDVVATGAELASSISGIAGFPVTGLTLKNLRVTARGGGKPELALRPVPEREKEYPDAGRFGDLPAYGLYCRHLDGLVLDGINLDFEEPDSRPAIVLDDVANADLRALAAKPPEGDGPVVRLQNVRDSFVQGCRALAGTRTWAALAGAQTAHVHEAGNDFSQATKPFELAGDVPLGAFKIESSAGR